jgi:hypothetical protein
MRFRRCVAAILFLIGTAAIVLLDMGGARLFGNDAFANVVSFTIKPSPQQNFPTSRPPASENSIGSYAPPAVQPHKHLTPISDNADWHSGGARVCAKFARDAYENSYDDRTIEVCNILYPQAMAKGRALSPRDFRPEGKRKS